MHYYDFGVMNMFMPLLVHLVFSHNLRSFILTIIWIERRNLELLTTHIRKPLVIPLAIDEYDENPQHAESENNNFRNLDSIDNDIKNMVSLFEDTFNYQIQPRYDINCMGNTYAYVFEERRQG